MIKILLVIEPKQKIPAMPGFFVLEEFMEWGNLALAL